MSESALEAIKEFFDSKIQDLKIDLKNEMKDILKQVLEDHSINQIPENVKSKLPKKNTPASAIFISEEAIDWKTLMDCSTQTDKKLITIFFLGYVFVFFFFFFLELYF